MKSTRTTVDRLRPALHLVLAIVVLAMILSPDATAQRKKKEGVAPKLDSVRFAYRFVRGQSVSYRVVSFDSIAIYTAAGEQRMSRERAEEVTFHCDTVLPHGYVMTATTTGYASTERYDTLDPIIRATHPWVDRPVTFFMDRLGQRIALMGPEGEPSSAPGAPFQPLLLPMLGDSGAYVGASRTFDDAQWLFENAAPPVYYSGTAFRVIARRVDTLREKCLELRLSSTGTMNYVPPIEADPTSVKVTINQGGNYYFAPKRGLPVGGRISLLANFTIDTKGGVRRAMGRHILEMSYEMIRDNEKPVRGEGKR